MVTEESSVMWVEKYRPKSLEEIVDHKAVIHSLNGFIKSAATVPHMLFSGPPGNGKTSAGLCLARQLLGVNWRSFTLELNASDERGIDMVREKIKTFSRHVMGAMANVPFGLVILDECDEMTSAAQTALRRVMEASSRTSRFILICNFLGKIIEPIQSRCAVFRFSPLKDEDISSHLKLLAKNEGISIQDSGMSALIQYCGGDLRRSINTLQAAAISNKTIDSKSVLQVVGQANPAEVQRMLQKALGGEFLEARKLLYELMASSGLAGTDIVRQVHREIQNIGLAEEKQVSILGLLADYDFRLTEGANDDIQLSAFLAQLSRYGLKE
ncbi:MAG: replication factor C small subunit [Candidatus Bathyarchaeia archaeon]